MPANSRLLAVVFVDWFIKDGKLYLRVKAFHNPYAAQPLPNNFFDGLAQYVVTETREDEVTMSTINDGNKVIELI